MPYRANAILLRGSPISHLPTARLFAYVTHFDIHPLALEWIDDNTCVFVFESKTAARTGYRHLQKSAAEEEDVDGFTTAKPIPVALWPPEERINKSLGKGQGLKGIIRMRWARGEDVKKKGAKKESEFYKKHGQMAGKELFNGREGQGSAKRRRKNGDLGDRLNGDLATRLDVELEEFLAEDDPEPVEPPSPPSKMRSDYIASDGRTTLEGATDTLASRITMPLPRRAREREKGSLAQRLWSDNRRSEPSDGKRSGGRSGARYAKSERQNVRPRKTQQELDEELDAFLNENE